MEVVRTIRKVWRARPTIEGAGVHLKRAFGYQEVPQLDPFLLLDDFRSGDPSKYLPGFPWHPHRGIETITYVLQGNVEHGDSMGNKGDIAAGDVQWMTAGSGIIHQEMPKGDAKGRMGGFQLWANLPASNKMMDPRYREVKRSQIPEVSLEGGAKVKIISGRVNGVQGPVTDIVTDPEYMDVFVPKGAMFTHTIRRGHTAFAYVTSGSAYFDPGRDPYARDEVGGNYFDMDRQCACPSESLVLYGDGDAISVTAENEPVRFLLVSGKPIGEPVAWYGPIVMNTAQELRVAFDEYQKGTFIKHR
ncbi:MAG: pirin family protein [Deltaproteobacteria bacterium]|nr:pirin family protein [Candidatus Deferrimicrobiaceae bacterium]